MGRQVGVTEVRSEKVEFVIGERKLRGVEGGTLGRQRTSGTKAMRMETRIERKHIFRFLLRPRTGFIVTASWRIFVRGTEVVDDLELRDDEKAAIFTLLFFLRYTN